MSTIERPPAYTTAKVFLQSFIVQALIANIAFQGSISNLYKLFHSSYSDFILLLEFILQTGNTSLYASFRSLQLSDFKRNFIFMLFVLNCIVLFEKFVNDIILC